MLKPIVLLVCATCFGLLDKSKGAEAPVYLFNSRCPSQLYDCIGRENGKEIRYTSVCVLFKWTGEKCKKAESTSQIEGHCRRQYSWRHELVFKKIKPTSTVCKLG